MESSSCSRWLSAQENLREHSQGPFYSGWARSAQEDLREHSWGHSLDTPGSSNPGSRQPGVGRGPADPSARRRHKDSDVTLIACDALYAGKHVCATRIHHISTLPTLGIVCSIHLDTARVACNALCVCIVGCSVHTHGIAIGEGPWGTS